MNQGMPSDPAPMPEPPKKSNTGIIIVVIVIILLCLCCVLAGVGYYLYQNGDQIFNTGMLIGKMV